MKPVVVRRELKTGKEVSVEGDMEGIPYSGEPGISCDHGLLYAAGYGHPEGRYQPEKAIVPFQRRDLHGISEINFEKGTNKLTLSTEEILQNHPNRDRLIEEDRRVKERLGEREGLTLMTYCVRWNPQGTRCLFYFGNHCVDKRREEPKVAYVFTTDREFKEIHLAVDLSFNRRGVHWGWQPDGEHLIGYGPREEDTMKTCLAEVKYDGTGYRKISDHATGGHPSVSPVDHDLIVTDGKFEKGGAIYFLSRKSGEVMKQIPLPKFIGESEAPGRNPLRICHHPVFSPDGDRVICNSLPDSKLATLVELTLR